MVEAGARKSKAHRRRRSGWKLLLAVLVMVGVIVAGAAAWAVWWVQAPLEMRTAEVELSIEPGTLPKEVARQWVEAGVVARADWLAWWFRASGQARQIRAGSYVARAGDSPQRLLERMVRGEESLETVRLGEGWNFRQVRQALAKASYLRQTLPALSDEQVALQLGLQDASSPEGWLFPDTYAYSRGVSDLTVLRRAHVAMQHQLQAHWAVRSPQAQLRSPQELLVLASVVEKETGLSSDRGQIAGVFNNRLRIGMPLQSDPTVIFGLGERFDGNLRKVDLQTDSPWNTYTRRGLPPTPIALPGQQALHAAARPAETKALYFVARGDGSSVFSETLEAHNRAVNQFQRSPRPPAR